MSLSISTIFDRDDLNFSELDNLLARARVSINFWGSRMVSIEGYEGEEPLSSFPELILKLGETFERSGDSGRSLASIESLQRGFTFPFLHRLHAVIFRIGILYVSSDMLLARRSSVTRAMNCLGETLTFSYRTSSFEEDFFVPIVQIILPRLRTSHQHEA